MSPESARQLLTSRSITVELVRYWWGWDVNLASQERGRTPNRKRLVNYLALLWDEIPLPNIH